jgi:hypothetical protein
MGDAPTTSNDIAIQFTSMDQAVNGWGCDSKDFTRFLHGEVNSKPTWISHLKYLY